MATILKIGKVIPTEQIKNVYEIKVNIMHGDADHYEDLTFHLETEDEVNQYIDLLDRMEAEYPHGRGGGDDYDHLDGFNELLGDDWPGDVTSDSMYQASMDGYVVTYYDENGVEYEVEVQYSEGDK
ncbi:MAG: hypothetical protein K0R18_167 [Bacillales bacterium]|jgi:hypothetical protein|nr:hypothetical protein [Bacillales bacterium]